MKTRSTLLSGLGLAPPSARGSERFAFFGPLFLVAVMIAAPQADAHLVAPPPSLKSVSVPPIPGLLDGAQPIVIDRAKAIALGKALFWDMNVGSDGMACGSCHFHAGADVRTRNQFSPGKAHMPGNPSDPNAFDPADPRGPNLSNYQLKKSDFPLYRFDGTTGQFLSASNTHNAVASSGTFSGQFNGIDAAGNEQCSPLADNTFQLGGIHTRRIEPRNAPTFINAVLFDRQFWDGRANFYYNGVTPWGPRDPNAFVWVLDSDNIVWKTRLALPNASMASLAMGPPVNEFEMSCRNRTLKDIGRKLLSRRPLESQDVHAQDSVLGSYRDASGKGLNISYQSLIQQAFAPRFWAAGTIAPFGGPSYSTTGFSQVESNFSLFFGIAIQLYASTLISDDTPFDNSHVVIGPTGYVDNNNVLTAQQLSGMEIVSNAHCMLSCHIGPLFSAATNRNTYNPTTQTSVQRTMMERVSTQDSDITGLIRLQDKGFRNNGSVPSAYDPGIDNVDDFGNPLSFAPQYLAWLASNPANLLSPGVPPANPARARQIIEPLPQIRACDFVPRQFGLPGDFTGQLVPDPVGSAGCSLASAAVVPRWDVVDAALNNWSTERRIGPPGHLFKIPQLYNVALTGPYMHNGGFSNLEQVAVQYLEHGGDFSFGNFLDTTATKNLEVDGTILSLSGSAIADVVAFLDSLTDERVRYERAPFDHPQVIVPNGHPLAPGGSGVVPSASDPSRAQDSFLDIPAVGSGGRATPLDSFDTTLPN